MSKLIMVIIYNIYVGYFINKIVEVQNYKACIRDHQGV